MMNEQWRAVCRLDDIEPETGVGVRLPDHRQAALFRTRDDRLFALDNHDPFSHANVLARGLLGSLQGRRVVASPIYKQHFCLDTGQCLEDEGVRLSVYPVRVSQGQVELLVEPSP
ncbi:nitrite reductase small subunit NirD [Alloalcanivorax profundimaris]|uniref:nitrite reductase small subunit NirD n=1 Tax=Alloalcanivorax profundimaris TaxID=2735259 RepID=UPI000C48323C|nr:nitrite reductase small subunit NirD [Alloalcanivorax profundimaris]MAO60598.1 nitrite reductase (NAD(P)H) small subunit [Alcanivorax sp.]MCQ6262329.1 nitrite reductase small subunit NirD [Alcanivorax sp. MM125-6]MBF1800535.1 nitrite reductase small subunit NirD [Alloalcanivorax profundimaris]MBI55735.1 nitrite reductase (NAD(P)H) small subunit [Alcanivorax sp.]HCE40038.1 nitrite reductase (NAD(P)H) small subunit [Alcanivorax sp.]|tara:strand:- start:6 stop:350 length:345 start_codon:yes stop_codon:yes gene_type:complete